MAKWTGMVDLERLLTRVHSNGLKRTGSADHPDSRAVLFDSHIYNARKIRDFADVLTGFETVLTVMESFQTVEICSQLLMLACKKKFPHAEMKSLLKHYREIFDEKQAKRDGHIRPR